MDTQEKYRQERINSSIEDYKRKRKIALITIYSAIAHCTELSPQAKEKARKIVYTLETAKAKKKYNVKKQLENKLKKQLESKRYISSYDISDTIENNAKSYRVSMDWQERQSISTKISQNPARAAINAASDYIFACNRIEQLQEELANPPKKVEKKQEPKKQTQPRTPTYESPKKPPVTTGTTYSPEDFEGPKGIKIETIPQPYTYSDPEHIKYQKTLEYLITKYQKKAEDKIYTTRVFLEADDKKMLDRLFGENSYIIIRDIEETLEHGYSLEATLNKFRKYNRLRLIPFQNPEEPKFENLLDMALIVYNELPEELLTIRSAASEKAVFLERLTRQVGVMHYLEKYEEAYNLYLKYYNKLSSEEKEELKTKFEKSNTVRFEKLGIKDFQILTPSELKNLVNYKVMDKMVENHYTYGQDNALDIHTKLRKATTFMEPSLIATTYHSIKREHDKYVSYESMTKQEIEYRREWFKNLQRNFAHLLLRNLSPEEKHEKTVDQQLYYVCKTILKEEPLFPLDLNKTLKEEQEAVEELYGTKKSIKEATGAVVADDHEYTLDYGNEDNIEATNTAVRAAYSARNRFFGMSKAEQTIQRITGKWAKFERAWAKAQQAKTQQEINESTEELNGMFRR